MSDITPTARLDIAYTRDAFGLMTYCGDDCTWHLADLIGRDDTQYTGFAADPTGDYLIQQPAIIAADADPSQWTLGGSGAFWGVGTDGSTGKTFLTQGGQAASSFSATFNSARPDDVGFRLDLFRAANQIDTGVASPTPPPMGANFSMYVEFSAGRQSGDYGLRLAIEAGNPIRLEGSFDGTSWTTLDIASDQGDSEDYLNANQRYLSVDVIPLTSRAWYDAYPGSSQWSDPPPDMIAVSLNNGDVVLKYLTDQLYLAAGSVSVYGVAGMWNCKYSHRRYVTDSTFTMNEIVRARPFQSDPTCYFRGFSPFDDLGVLTPTLTDTNKCYVSGEISASPDDIDTTGYCLHTVALSTADVHFPIVYQGPQAVPAQTSFTPVELSESHWFDQSTFCVRSQAMVVLEDNGGALSPANLIPAVRAAALTRGWVYEDGSTDACVGITGLTALDAIQGIRWFWQGKQKYVQISISDLLRRGDSDLATVGYLLPFDSQCHFYSVRQLCYRMGIGDDRMTSFPYCQRDSPCGHFHLASGTNANPLYRFQPQTSPMSAILQIRAVSGEYGPDGKTILPMYFGMDANGNVQYFPAPIGLVNQWLNPDQSVGQNSVPIFKTYKMEPEFSAGYPNLNEFVGDGMGTTATLANIRPLVILEGMSPKDGSLILGTSFRPDLGIDGDGNSFGYIGSNSAYMNISRLFSSEQAVKIALQTSVIQTSFPAVKVGFQAHFQSQLFPLTTIAVEDYGTQGNQNAVAYYATAITNRMSLRSTPSATTDVGARLLGQAA